LSYYSPQPKQRPKRLPRRYPLKTIPSGIGDEGIVGNWLFYYLKGGDHLHDFSPENNHGTIYGAKWVDGRYGWALDFDGIDDYVSTPINPYEEEFTTVTLSVWFKRRSVDGGNPFFQAYDGTNYWGFNLNKNAYYIWKTYDGTVHGITTTIEAPLNKWTHLVGVFNGTSYILYENGEEIATEEDSTFVNPNKEVHIGYYPPNDEYYNGTLGVFRIYKTAKSASWVEQRFERTRGIFGV